MATTAFQSVSIILPVMDETVSLAKTIDIALRDARVDIREFIIVVCERTLPASIAKIEELRQQMPELITIHHQKLPFVGGAYRECFDFARGSHVIMMASDLETEPNDVKRLIAEAKGHPNAVIATSRWLLPGSFKGYSLTKLIANWIFQRIFSCLYGTNLTDMTFGYRLFTTELLQSIKWEELRHPFFFETVIKPVRLGVEIVEIPTTWGARIEGESHNSFFRNFEYFPTGFRVRFMPIKSILKADIDQKKIVGN